MESVPNDVLPDGVAAPERDCTRSRACLVDPFGRAISYLRVSVTDRCDLRCFYCMSEDMTFLPKADLLTLEELDRLCSAFIAKGVRKIRLTGGEPLVRRNVMSLVRTLSRHLSSGALDELTLTTNGSQLARFAGDLRDCGVKRVSETGGKLGFITPMTHNFCESCNRVRITCTGTLHTCLGHEDASDLRKPLRASPDDDLLAAAIDRAIGLKPKGHDFIIDRRHNRPRVSRHMSVTGG